MRIYEIKLLGKQADDGVPKCLVSIQRPFGGDGITVNITTLKSERKYYGSLNRPQDIRTLAECIQYELDGCKGTLSEIQEYYKLLESFSD
jgi:hypothetical protein